MIRATAPAKIILFGEHAVVHGQPAIAVPISSLRAAASVEAPETPGQGLHILADDLQLRLPVNIDSSEVQDTLSLTARLVLEKLNLDAPDITIRLQSQIPMASGLGSGAAVATALARALSEALGQPLEPVVLNELIYEVEKLNHGTPSGIDNTVIVHERPVYYVRGSDIATIRIGRPFRLLIADTGIAALTRVAVGDVGRLYASSPGEIGSVLSEIGRLAADARAHIERGTPDALGPLLVRNHELLQSLTVSSPELDRLVDAALAAGALGAKLSGGGRGGNMIALVTDETAGPVRQALVDAGAVRVFDTVVE